MFRADALIVSVPLGVLKSSAITFHPPLPEWKTQAIHNLGFGLLNKVSPLVWERYYYTNVWTVQKPQKCTYGLYICMYVLFFVVERWTTNILPTICVLI